MQQPLGENIRLLRRLRNLTQAELGGERFSKSYVSAVEHNKIVPSREALCYFAEQLHQPGDYFEPFLRRSEISSAIKPFSPPDTIASLASSHTHKPGALALLDKLLEDAEVSHIVANHDLPVLAPEVVAGFPPSTQARYFFLLGLQAREQDQLPAALQAFETALPLAPSALQAAILDEIGFCYSLLRRPLQALGYYFHALHLLSREPADNAITGLRFQCEIHCGDAYQALGAYQQALEQYETAHGRLKLEHNLQTAGALCEGLGYCLYAARFPFPVPGDTAASQASPEETEQILQRAISFLLQSRSVYQVSGDRWQESRVRLLLAFIRLDMSNWRRRLARDQARRTGKPASARSSVLLNEAEEECRQVLLNWSHAPGSAEAENVSAEQEVILYAALAGLLRVSVQRTALARQEGNYVETASRERAAAAHLAGQVLEMLAGGSSLWLLIRQVTGRADQRLASHTSALPPLIELARDLDGIPAHRAPGLAEIFFAVGEVAEESGRVASTPAYAHDCYQRANQYLRAALALVQIGRAAGEQDPGYLARLYQRCVDLLEERLLATPDLNEETTVTLLDLLKDGLRQFQQPYRVQEERLSPEQAAG